ncbi:glutamate-1-semialdehyde 2,1-aminomutase [Thiotrichales bacterium 19S3-7]|nr:glutamate-1-semialdehyde 2,1-aminomutase [Thiotrichales bacterium 19S3-7]MCF6801238.1 glutamate-1-semialdehyde 2,1-aminomutase [Thiotrichales bacterium 19S3-11]
MTIVQSEQLFNQAQKFIPGGVNSPVRAFKAVGGNPRFIDRAKGAYIYDVDGNRYIDYVGSWGPMIVGHAHEYVIDAVKSQSEKGLSYGAPCQLEVQLAESLCKLIPNMDQVRFVNSGTEATMSAIRLARAYTSRNKLIKFKGCYHGHADHLLVAAGSGALTLGIPGSPGVPNDTVKDTLTANFNDLTSVEQCFKAYPNDIACIILEPIAGNMNLVIPDLEFIQGLRKLCDQYGAVLIFDEVMTGFRVALNGAQSLFNVKADLITLGKVIGGGMPVGAFGGNHEIMQHLAPCGDVYQAGTLSGNPIAMTAGLATLELIQKEGFYNKLTHKANYLIEKLNQIAIANQIDLKAQAVGSMFGLYFSNFIPKTFDEVNQSNINHFKPFFNAMLQHGIYLAPSAYEAGFISSAHTIEDLDDTINKAQMYFANIYTHV